MSWLLDIIKAVVDFFSQQHNLKLQQEASKRAERPSLLVEVQWPPFEGTSEDDFHKRVAAMKLHEKWRGLRVTNVGRGSAVMHRLNYGEGAADLNDAELAPRVYADYPCKEMLSVLEKGNPVPCSIEYSDILGNGYRQHFRVNLDNMAAVLLHLEEICHKDSQ